MSTRFDLPERDPLGPDIATVVATPIVPPPSESAVSWGAIFAGAVAAAALSLILLILGVGLGLSSVSPWSFEGVSKETFDAACPGGGHGIVPERGVGSGMNGF